MIPAILAAAAAALILGAIAFTLVWTVVGVERDLVEIDAEMAERDGGAL